jgi:hypothetical protein
VSFGHGVAAGNLLRQIFGPRDREGLKQFLWAKATIDFAFLSKINAAYP